MAALVVVNSDCSKLSKATIKKAIRDKLTTVTIYKFWGTKTIPEILKIKIYVILFYRDSYEKSN
jgi:hypothetical protein